MSWRTKKRLIYLSSFFLFLIFISFLIYLLFQQPRPQCSNSRQDTNEEGIDCGGPCPPCELKYFRPLKIYPASYITYLDKTYDLVGIVENLNPNLALLKLKYQFLIYDFNDNLKITTPIEETILLPLEKRYLTRINNPDPGFTINKVELKIIEPSKEDWLKSTFEKLPINVYNVNIFEENNRWKASLTLFNNSYVYQPDIEVIVFVYNENNLVGVARGVYSLYSQETKEIILTLPRLLFKPTGYEIYLQRKVFQK